MTELNDYLNERELEVLMQAPRRDRDLTKPRKKQARSVREMALEGANFNLRKDVRNSTREMAAAPPKPEPEPEPLPHPRDMDTRTFLIFVSDDAKDELLDHEAQQLREPDLVESWFWALGHLIQKLNAKFMARSKKPRISTEDRRWRPKAIAYKLALETRRAELKPQVDAIRQEKHRTKVDQDNKEYRTVMEEVLEFLEREEPFVYHYWPKRDALRSKLYYTLYERDKNGSK